MAPPRSGETKNWLMRRAAAIHHRLWLMRAMTLGVRVVVLDGERVLLVRHTYISGWYLPGGAVDAGESAEAAAVRELREEAGIACRGRPQLHGFYRNKAHSRRDHVACYVIRDFEATTRAPDWEIAEIGFFAAAALPDGTSAATRARIAEVLGGERGGEDW